LVIDIGPGQTTGQVRHEAIGGIADAATNRAEPVDLVLAVVWVELMGAAPLVADIAGSNICLEAEHDIVLELPVIADLRATEAAGQCLANGVRVMGILRMAPAIAAMNTNVEAGPVKGLDHGGDNRCGLIGQIRSQGG